MWAPDQWKVNKGKNSDSPFTVQYYRPMLANTRQSWILDPIPWIQDSGVLDSSLFQWNFIP